MIVISVHARAVWQAWRAQRSARRCATSLVWSRRCRFKLYKGWLINFNCRKSLMFRCYIYVIYILWKDAWYSRSFVCRCQISWFEFQSYNFFYFYKKMVSHQYLFDLWKKKYCVSMARRRFRRDNRSSIASMIAQMIVVSSTLFSLLCFSLFYSQKSLWTFCIVFSCLYAFDQGRWRWP